MSKENQGTRLFFFHTFLTKLRAKKSHRQINKVNSSMTYQVHTHPFNFFYVDILSLFTIHYVMLLLHNITRINEIANVSS